MASESENGSVCSSQDKENTFALTEQQQNFIAECEKLFANRYTEEDPDYKAIAEGGIGDPPIVDPWYNKPKRNFSWAGRREDRRSEPFRNDHRDDRRDRDRDRYTHRRFDSEGSRRDSYRNDRRDSYRGRDDASRNRSRYQSYHRDPRHSY